MLNKRMNENTATIPWWKRVGWLVVIWSASVLGLFLVASLFRLLMTAAGMKPE